MAAILYSAILNLAIFDSSILVCPLKLTHTCQDWFPPFAQKNFTHSFWLNLMMAAILNSAKLDSDPSWICPCWIQTLPSWIQTPCYLLSDSLKSTLHSSLILTQTNSIWLKLINSDLNWWWQPSCILPFWFLPDILDSAILLKTLTPTNSIWLKVIYTASTWWWWPSWIQPFSTKKLHSFILTQLDVGIHLEYCHVGFRHCHHGIRHLVFFSSDLLKNTLHSTMTLTQNNSMWLT